MKKILYFFLAGLLCLSLSLSLSVSADLNDPDLPRVVDEADLLSDGNESDLADRIEKIKNKYDYDIVILTVDSLDGYTPVEFADDYYDYNGYGAGDDKSGMLFLLSMEERDWYISTCGYGITAFTDYGIDLIGDKVVSNFSDGNYYDGFSEFLDLADEFLEEASNGTPYDVGNRYKSTSTYVVYVLIGLGIGIIAGFAVAFTMKAQMKSVRPQNNADSYILKDTFKVRNSNDVFLYKNVSKTKRETSSGSSSGGSSTHTSSSGTTHGGGGGKF